MATINTFTRTTKMNKPTNVRFRIRQGNVIDIEYKSDILIHPLLWDSKKQIVKSSKRFPNEDTAYQNKMIIELKLIIQEIVNTYATRLTTSILSIQIKNRLNPVNTIPQCIEPAKLSFFEIFDIFLKKHDLSDERRESYMVVKRALERFEYVYQQRDTNFVLSLDSYTHNHLVEIELFLHNEFEYAQKNNEYKARFSYYRSNKTRGINTVTGMLHKLRAFNNWAIKHDYTTNYPFKKYEFKECIYGTPIFLTLDELKTIYEHKFHFNRQLESQRDIFIFQSLTGLRVGDMYKLTQANIINGCLHYIPQKTKKESGRTVVVPLNKIATTIIDKYKNSKLDTLFPFISFQQYNNKIKDVLTLSGITRNVTVINSITRNYEIKPINQIASSHLARRNFIANLYLHVQDQAMLSSLTGHVPNSKSFERYRQITDELKVKLINHLNFK